MHQYGLVLYLQLLVCLGFVATTPFHNHASNNWHQSAKQGDLVSSRTDDATLSASVNDVEEFDGFISYRRTASRHLAMLVKVLLAQKNISAYLDVEDLEGGEWDVQLMQNIETAPNFILVLSNGTLERCKGDFNYTDFLHREIKAAVDQEKRIVLLLDEFDWPSAEFFSPEINAALANQGIVWQHHLVDQSLERLMSYMRMDAPQNVLEGNVRTLHFTKHNPERQ